MPHLTFKLTDGSTAQLQLPVNSSAAEELGKFSRRQGQYDSDWIALSEHRILNRDSIIEVTTDEFAGGAA